MKNKLFLALALAGVVACKKDNTPTPSPNTNDVNAQVTDFINKLDLSKDLATQVEAFAKTLKNDTEMENLLVGKARTGKEWNLVPFETVKVYETGKKTLDNTVILNENNTAGKDYTFEDYKLNFTDNRPWYFNAPFPFTLQNDGSNDGWKTYKGMYYTKQGVLYLYASQTCFKDAQEGVDYFVDVAYEHQGAEQAEIAQKKKTFKTYFGSEELCYESFSTTANTISTTANAKIFTHQQDEDQETVVLKSKDGKKSKTYKLNYIFKTDVKYETK
jgi:hypothetical protein